MADAELKQDERFAESIAKAVELAEQQINAHARKIKAAQKRKEEQSQQRQMKEEKDRKVGKRNDYVRVLCNGRSQKCTVLQCTEWMQRWRSCRPAFAFVLHVRMPAFFDCANVASKTHALECC
jgi:hypothetical protein